MAIPFIGKIIDSVVNKGGDIIKKMVKDKDLAERLTHEFRTQVEDNRAEYEAAGVQAEKEMFADQQVTIQAELHQNDQYTKRTRPIIARRSFYAGLAYAMLTSLPEAGINLHYVLVMPWQFQWSVLMLLYSPALTYMGVRGAEKWRAMKA